MRNQTQYSYTSYLSTTKKYPHDAYLIPYEVLPWVANIDTYNNFKHNDVNYRSCGTNSISANGLLLYNTGIGTLETPDKIFSFDGNFEHEIKLEFCNRITSDSDITQSICCIYFDGVLVEKLTTDEFQDGFFNPCHLTGGLILNCPTGLIRVTDFDISRG
jgi:hypothetical protein